MKTSEQKKAKININKNQSIPFHIYREVEKISKKNKLTITAIINIAIGEWLRSQKMFK